MEEKICFRRYIQTDDQDLCALTSELLGLEGDDQFFEWKYRKNPAGRALSVVAEKNGKVIGQIGAIPVRLLVEGREVIGSLEADGCLDKKEGKFDTLFHLTLLRRKINQEDGIDFSYFFSRPISSKIATTMKFIRVCAVPFLMKILDIEPFLLKRLKLKTFSKLLSFPVNALLRLLYPARRICPKGTQIKKIERFDERFDAFWYRIRGDYPIMTVRDSSYLNWRYVDVPHRDYVILALEKTGTTEILGFVVLGDKHREYMVGQLLDIVTPRNSGAEITRALLAHAMLHFYERKVALVICYMLPHCHVFPRLRKLGFRPYEEDGMDLIFRNTNVQKPTIPIELPSNKENWYLSVGDSDFY